MKNCAIKLLCFTFYSLFVALNSHIFISFFLPILVLLFLLKGNFFEIFKKLIFLNFFLVFLVLGAFLEDAYASGILIFFRSNLIVFFGILLFHNVDIYEISQGILDLGFGKKISTLIYFCLNFINSLKSEFARLKMLLKVRGFSAQTSVFTYKIYANLIAILFLFALKKSENLQKTMIVRGFDGVFHNRKSAKPSVFELSFLILTLFCVILKFGVVL